MAAAACISSLLQRDDERFWHFARESSETSDCEIQTEKWFKLSQTGICEAEDTFNLLGVLLKK
jgi:hypothetical protein